MSKSHFAECVDTEHVSFALIVGLSLIDSTGELGKAEHAGFSLLKYKCICDHHVTSTAKNLQ